LKEVKAIFGEDENLLSSIEDVRPEVGDNYFVRFSDEEKTMNAWNYVRSQKFKEKPIQARIKSESILRNSYVLSEEPFLSFLVLMRRVRYYVDPAVLHYQQQQAEQQQKEGGNLYSNSFWDQRQGYNPGYRGGRGGRYNNTNGSTNGGANNGTGRRGGRTNNKDYNPVQGNYLLQIWGKGDRYTIFGVHNFRRVVPFPSAAALCFSLFTFNFL
jgi:hypothetical protein